MKYSKKRKEAVLKKMMAPHNRSIKDLADEEGICEATLYNWRNQARKKGLLLPDSDTGPLEDSLVRPGSSLKTKMILFHSRS